MRRAFSPRDANHGNRFQEDIHEAVARRGGVVRPRRATVRPVEEREGEAVQRHGHDEGRRGPRSRRIEDLFAKYRDGRRIVRTVATGCRDEQAARSVLGDLERRAELIRSGVMTQAEDAAADHLRSPIAEHREAYLTHLTAKGVSPDHHANVERQLIRLMEGCGFATLADLDPGAVERWLIAQSKPRLSPTTKQIPGMSPRTRNSYLSTLLAFANWSVEEGRLTANPFARLSRADENSDTRRKRRAMTEAELTNLLDVARADRCSTR